MKIYLIHPPIWSPHQPYLSLPSLTAFMRKHGYEIDQFDLNVKVFNHFFTKEFMSKCYQKITTKVEEQVYPTEQRDTVLKALCSKKAILEDVDRVIPGLKNGDLFKNSIKDFLKINALQRFIMEIISLAYYPDKICTNLYDSSIKLTNGEQMVKEIEQTNENIFYELYKEEFLQKILPNQPDLIGISVTSENQVVPTLYLCKAIKEVSPSTHICLGGNLISKWSKVIKSETAFFKYFDSAVLFQGEKPLLELVQALENKTSLSKVSNLLYKDYLEDGTYQIVANELSEPITFELLPTPDYDGLPLDEYITPELNIPLLTARGCYWQKCTFCDHFFNFQHYYSLRPVEMLIQDIKLLKQKHNVKYINFGDECISPAYMKSLSTRLLEEELEIYWSTELRMEEKFKNKEYWELAYKAGLRLVYFGFESANQHVIDCMRKGVKVSDYEVVLEQSSKAGVWNHMFSFFGFPTETEVEALDTIEFLSKFNDRIHSIGCGTYTLQKNSPVGLEPAKYALKVGDKQDNLSLKYQFEYLDNSHKNSEYYMKRVHEEKYVKPHYYRFSSNISRDFIHIFLSYHTPHEFESIFTPQKKRLDFNQYFKLKDTVYFAKVNGSLYVFDYFANEFYEFNDFADLIFQKIRQEISLPLLLEQFFVENNNLTAELGQETIEREIQNFLVLLDDNDLVVTC